MMTRIRIGALRSSTSPAWHPRHALRRCFSTENRGSPIQFSYSIPEGREIDSVRLFNLLKDKKALDNPNKHDAAVVLATPGLTRLIENEEFMGELARVLSGNAGVDRFHILGAIVDHVAPPVGSYKPLQGISVLRGHLDQILPQLWQPSPPKSREDADKLSALTFEIGRPLLTMPLARTTFLNGRGSTLFASQFDLKHETPKLLSQMEKHSQSIIVSTETEPQVIADLGLSAPLIPLTLPRAITESLGNIIRGIEVDGDSVPASTELENIVNSLHKHGAGHLFTSGPIGVWALVTPDADMSTELNEWLENGPAPIAPGQAAEDVEELTKATMKHVEELYSYGGRLFKILSGGGGWGAKKGLLSLDPQRTHFALSEEEEMENFMQTMSGSGFTPKGSRIQFFMSSPSIPPISRPLVPGISFGVPGEVIAPEDPEAVEGFLGQHFGALSNEAVYLSGPGSYGGQGSKISVPHSRIYVADASHDASSTDPSLWSLLPDIGAVAIAESI